MSRLLNQLFIPVIAGNKAAVQTVSISGTVTDGVTPVEGVLMTFGDYSATTGVDGTYTIADVPVDTTASLTPSKTSYQFQPASIDLITSTMLGNLTGEDFTPYLMLFYDTFTTDDAAPISSPRTAEPGPGTIAITDAANIMSLASGGLVINGTASGTNTGFLVSDAITRAAGRAFSQWLTSLTAAGIGRLGLGTSMASGSFTHRISPATTNMAGYEGTTLTHTVPASYPCAITVVERATGAFYLLGSKLFWVARAGTGDPKPLSWFAASQAPNMNFAAIQVADLISMNADSKVYSYFDATPTANDTATMEADAIIEFDWVCATDETLVIEFRKVDDDNLLKLVCSQADSTMRVYKRISGTDTGTTMSGTPTFVNGTTYRLTIICDGTKIYVYNNLAYVGVATVTDFATATGVKVSGFAAGANLYTWKTNLAALMPEFLYPNPPSRYYLVVGDSKSVNDVWESKFEALINSPAAKWETVDRIATVGRTVHTVKVSDIDARLALLDATPAPEYALINLGTNDAGEAIGDGSTWVTEYQYIIDAIHTKWASCQVYLMRPYRPDFLNDPSVPYDFATPIAAIKALIPDVISGRAWAHLGPDETVFLENGDGGATYINLVVGDCIHPLPPGYTLTAQQWKTALGL